MRTSLPSRCVGLILLLLHGCSGSNATDGVSLTDHGPRVITPVGRPPRSVPAVESLSEAAQEQIANYEEAAKDAGLHETAILMIEDLRYALAAEPSTSFGLETNPPSEQELRQGIGQFIDRIPTHTTFRPSDSTSNAWTPDPADGGSYTLIVGTDDGRPTLAVFAPLLPEQLRDRALITFIDLPGRAEGELGLAVSGPTLRITGLSADVTLDPVTTEALLVSGRLEDVESVEDLGPS